MTTYRKIRNRVRQSLRSQPIAQGILGDGAGNVKVSGSSYQCYARVGDRKAPIIVTNLSAPMQDGLPVIIGEDRVNPGLRQVLGVNYYSGVDYPENPAIGAHAPSHRYDGTDPVYLDSSQILPLSVRSLNDGLKVRVYSGMLVRPTGAAWVTQTTVDMADHLPASGYSWNLVQVSEAGVVSVIEGTAVDDLFALTYALIPAADGNNLPLAAVRLSAGKTAFSLMFTNPDIRDLRMFGIRSFDLDDLADVNAPSPNDGQLLAWDDGAGEWVAADIAGVLALDDLTDVTISSPTDNQLLRYDDGTSQWVNETVSYALDDLSDVDTTGAVAGDALMYDGSSWGPGTREWSVLTDGDLLGPEVVFVAGDVVMVEVVV